MCGFYLLVCSLAKIGSCSLNFRDERRVDRLDGARDVFPPPAAAATVVVVVFIFVIVVLS